MRYLVLPEERVHSLVDYRMGWSHPCLPDSHKVENLMKELQQKAKLDILLLGVLSWKHGSLLHSPLEPDHMRSIMTTVLKML